MSLSFMATTVFGMDAWPRDRVLGLEPFETAVSFGEHPLHQPAERGVEDVAPAARLGENESALVDVLIRCG